MMGNTEQGRKGPTIFSSKKYIVYDNLFINFISKMS